MDELGRDQFPKECWGCYENCYSCTRKIGSASVPVIRDFVALKMLKQQAIVRMQRDVERIDGERLHYPYRLVFGAFDSLYR